AGARSSLLEDALAPSASFAGLRRPETAGGRGRLWLVAELLCAVIPTAKRPASLNPANRKSKRYSVHYTPTASWNQPMALRDMQEPAPPTTPKLEFSAAEIGALAHLYRGEVYRSTAWRTRLDSTTNWAVVTTGIALSATFSSAEASPLPMVLVGLIVSVFLLFEARRYRYFNVWRARTRLLETDFYAPMIRGEGIRLGAGWTELLAKDYCEPRYHVSFARAIGRRLRRT